MSTYPNITTMNAGDAERAMRDNMISSNEGAVLAAVAKALMIQVGYDLDDIEVDIDYTFDRVREVRLHGKPIRFR